MRRLVKLLGLHRLAHTTTYATQGANKLLITFVAEPGGGSPAAGIIAVGKGGFARAKGARKRTAASLERTIEAKARGKTVWLMFPQFL